MRAATYQRTGPAADVLELRDMPRPVPAAGELLVRVMASGINPADVKRRSGWNGAAMAHPLVVPHCDGAGVLEDVGDGVDRAHIGKRIWMWNAQGGYGEAGRAFGTAAEFITLPALQTAPLPDNLDFAEGACLGVPALTAWLAVLGDGAVQGKTLLIQGGAGAVGQMCVQMALARGARVLVTISGDAGASAVNALGEVTVIDRHKDDIAEEVANATDEGGVERIIEVDLAANLATDVSCLAPHGIIASYSCSSDPTPVLPYYALADLGAVIRFVQGFRLRADQRARAQEDINNLITSGQLRPTIGAIYPLKDIAAAHVRVEAGGLGQTVLTLPSENRSPT